MVIVQQKNYGLFERLHTPSELPGGPVRTKWLSYFFRGRMKSLERNSQWPKLWQWKFSSFLIHKFPNLFEAPQNYNFVCFSVVVIPISSLFEKSLVPAARTVLTLLQNNPTLVLLNTEVLPRLLLERGLVPWSFWWINEDASSKLQWTNLLQPTEIGPKFRQCKIQTECLLPSQLVNFPRSEMAEDLVKYSSRNDFCTSVNICTYKVWWGQRVKIRIKRQYFLFGVGENIKIYKLDAFGFWCDWWTINPLGCDYRAKVIQASLETLQQHQDKIFSPTLTSELHVASSLLKLFYCQFSRIGSLFLN